MPWRQQSRTAQARGARMTRQQKNQQLYNRTSLTSRAHRGSLSKRREFVLSSLPTPPPPLFFFADSQPPVSKVKYLISIVFALHLYVSYVQSHHFPTTTWSPEHPFFSTHCYLNTSSNVTCVLGGGSFPVTTHGFSSGQRGCCCQGKEVVPVDHIRGKGLSSRLTSGLKIRLTAGFEPCPQGPTPSSLAAAHSPF